MPANDRSNIEGLDMSIFQDVSRSVDQLCTQMSINNVIVPRFNPYTDVFDFLTEYEIATTALAEDQKLRLLVRSFPRGHHRSWYETELAPTIKQGTTWANVKDKIIQRFSDTEDRDRHFLKLRELSFDPESGHRLLDFVEDIIYSYQKAYPSSADQEACVKYVKAAIPISLKSTLSMISGYSDAVKTETLKKAVKQFDTSRSGIASQKTANQSNSAELTSLLKEMITSIKKESEVTRTAMVAAVKASGEAGYRSNQVTDNRPSRNSYSPRRQDYRSSEQRMRSQSPNYRDARNQSPHRYNFNNQPGKEQSSKVESEGIKQLNQVNEAFNSEMYFAKFQKPPSPCSDCGYWHWNRHCVKHLN